MGTMAVAPSHWRKTVAVRVRMSRTDESAPGGHAMRWSGLHHGGSSAICSSVAPTDLAPQVADGGGAIPKRSHIQSPSQASRRTVASTGSSPSATIRACQRPTASWRGTRSSGSAAAAAISAAPSRSWRPGSGSRRLHGGPYVGAGEGARASASAYPSCGQVGGDVRLEFADDLVHHAGDQGVTRGEVIEHATLAEAGLGRGRVEGEVADAVTQDDLLGGVEDAGLGVAPSRRCVWPAGGGAAVVAMALTIPSGRYSCPPGRPGSVPPSAEVPGAADGAGVGVEIGPVLEPALERRPVGVVAGEG